MLSIEIPGCFGSESLTRLLSNMQVPYLSASFGVIYVLVKPAVSVLPLYHEMQTSDLEHFSIMSSVLSFQSADLCYHFESSKPD